CGRSAGSEGSGNHTGGASPQRRSQRIWVLEAIRMRMEDEGIGFDAAVPRVSREVVFTTHTPVPAGHDRFDAKLVEEHIGPLREALGLSEQSLLGLGREKPNNSDESFCMTVLALRLSRRANAVSAL